jgi:multiple sugar transport system substrate-binding protein
MNKARKFIMLAVAVVTVLTLSQGAFTAKAAKVTVNWFVGLGTGTQSAQVEAQNKLVEKFNASHPDIELKISIASTNQEAKATMQTLIASGNAPDIVGPVGVEGSNAFAGQWLDLTDLVAKNKYDIAQFPANVVKIYTEGDKLYGIPFATFPGVLYYNKDLFKEAGLEMPPTKFGEKYKLDGKEVEWDYDTVAKIAQILTVDASGKDATDPAFDATKTVQFGFDHTFDTMRSDLATFGGAPVVDDKGKVVITESERANIHWMWDAIWKYHFMPNTSWIGSDLLKPNTFGSGKLAMTRSMLWFTCCAESKDKPVNFDLAPQPAYKGKTFAPADADTFRIYKGTKNPDAAFAVLTYLLGEAAPDLLQVYGAFPARADLQAPFVETMKKAHPSVTNWSIIGPSFDVAAVPHHESAYPNYLKGQDRFAQFATWIRSDEAGKVDAAGLDKEIDKLQSDLQALVDSAGK